MAYRNAFNTNGNRLNTQSLSKKISKKGVVARMNSDVKNGNSYYYFTMEGEDKIFVGTTQISNDFPLTYAKDSIEIMYENDKEKLIGVSSFSNLSIQLK
jgi:regulatory protein YycI of two-component signal transduction system YycFG